MERNYDRKEYLKSAFRNWLAIYYFTNRGPEQDLRKPSIEEISEWWIANI